MSSLIAISDGIKKFHTYDLDEESTSEMSMPDLAQPEPSSQVFAADSTITHVSSQTSHTVKNKLTTAAQSSIKPTVLNTMSNISTSYDPRRISTMKLVSDESQGCAVDQPFEHKVFHLKHQESLDYEIEGNADGYNTSMVIAVSDDADNNGEAERFVCGEPVMGLNWFAPVLVN